MTIRINSNHTKVRLGDLKMGEALQAEGGIYYCLDSIFFLHIDRGIVRVVNSEDVNKDYIGTHIFVSIDINITH